MCITSFAHTPPLITLRRYTNSTHATCPVVFERRELDMSAQKVTVPGKSTVRSNPHTPVPWKPIVVFFADTLMVPYNVQRLLNLPEPPKLHKCSCQGMELRTMDNGFRILFRKKRKSPGKETRGVLYRVMEEAHWNILVAHYVNYGEVVTDMPIPLAVAEQFCPGEATAKVFIARDLNPPVKSEPVDLNPRDAEGDTKMGGC
ncbi:hypothetical protein BZA05DRAFT_463786 [Tricharina praecox]|uniref:uncharacterized protein n=1 Tax=Tricharina praecox TaxID=43433 RepID=UPI00221E5E0C|nr:uncharacterized protein BZA05DRAFT_463786 [Tricharina praecox]KAI5856545.1 hypothetical protein BZA05DRAFT_463786 [Tricharina praecox]